MIYSMKWITKSISRYDYSFVVVVMLAEFAHFDLLEAIKPLALLNRIPFSLSRVVPCILRIMSNATLWSAEEYCTKWCRALESYIKCISLIHPKGTKTTINDFVLFFFLFLFLMKPWNAINKIAQFRNITIAFNCLSKCATHKRRMCNITRKWDFSLEWHFVVHKSYISMENLHDKNDTPEKDWSY